MFYKEILEQTGPESAVLEHLQALILKRFSPCANHGAAFLDSMYVPVCPKIPWICRCRVLNMPLELRDSFAFVFVFYPSAKLQFCDNEMSLLQMLIVLNILAIINLNTMFPSYQLAIAPFQFSYQIGPLFPLERIFLQHHFRNR